MRSFLAFLMRTGALAAIVLLAGCVQVTPVPAPSALPATETSQQSPTQEPHSSPTSTASPTVAAPTPDRGSANTKPTPSLAATETSTVRVYQSSVQFLSYPYGSFGRDVLDRTYNITYRQFDALAFGSAPRSPSIRTYRTLVVENEYLRLTFLPDLGGRLFQVMFKPTGQTLFYNNRVLKPTPWGPEQQGGWLAIGGMEWALPVNEHGYEWGAPWHYRVDSGRVSLWDTDATDRVRACINVTLPPHAAYFIVQPRVENPTRAPVSLQFWINAQIALNDGLRSSRLSPDLEFHLPGNEVWIHSTANSFIPEANIPSPEAASPASPVNWRQVGGRDLALYRDWDDYLGLFLVRPTEDFVGVYSPENALGLARVFPRERVPGVKLFAWGPHFQGRSLYSDDDSEYMELWGGLPRTFFRNDDVVLAPGEAREWEEFWIPFAGTGGFTAASSAAVLHLAADNSGRVLVDVAVTRATHGMLVLTEDEVELARWSVALEPGSVLSRQMQVERSGLFKLRLFGQDGTLLGDAFSN